MSKPKKTQTKYHIYKENEPNKKIFQSTSIESIVAFGKGIDYANGNLEKLCVSHPNTDEVMGLDMVLQAIEFLKREGRKHRP